MAKTKFECGEAAVAALPASVRIGPFDYEIVKMAFHDSDARRAWGQCSHIESVIRIAATLPTPVKAAHTFMHELMHAIYYACEISDDDKEERIVGFVATGLTALYRDNPWLLGWLADCLK